MTTVTFSSECVGEMKTLLLSLLLVLAFGAHSVTLSHFRGGTIQWRPINAAEVLIQEYIIIILLEYVPIMIRKYVFSLLIAD